MTPAHEDKPKRRAPRWMKVVLLLSLAVNLLIIGAVGTRFAFGPPFYGSHGLGAPGMMLIEGRHMLRKLPPERRRLLRRDVRMHRVELRGHRRNIAKARAELARLLDAGKLDMATFKASMVRLRKAESESHKTVSKLREGFILSLNPDERRIYARRLLRSYNRGRGSKDRPWWRKRQWR